MAIDVTPTNTKCFRCGKDYPKRAGYFSTSYAPLYRGQGYLPYCKECVDTMYFKYLSGCNNDPKLAVKQMCRKLDIYWSEKAYDMAEKKSTPNTIMGTYLSKVNTQGNMNRCYDDTLLEDGLIWVVVGGEDNRSEPEVIKSNPAPELQERTIQHDMEITDDIVAFWGSGYTDDMYAELEHKRQYWVSRLSENQELDIGTEALIKQICALEMDIARDRAAGKSVEKAVTAMNTLIGSMGLKPEQRKDAQDESLERTPMGVWLDRYEFKRPLPELDPKLKDVDGVVKYILAWVYGHLAKMFGVKNANLQLYEEEVEKYKVNRPEEADVDDDDEFMFDILGGSNKVGFGE